MASRATGLTHIEQRNEAVILRDQHDAEKQDHGYDRCELCHYTGHPCDVFDLASWLIDALDRVAELEAEYPTIPDRPVEGNDR